MSDIYTVSEIKRRLRPIFEAAPISRAVLFGSYSRGAADAGSDVDIVIDSGGRLINIDFYGVLEDITVALGKPVDLFEISEIRRDSPIYAEVMNGVVLYDA